MSSFETVMIGSEKYLASMGTDFAAGAGSPAAVWML